MEKVATSKANINNEHENEHEEFFKFPLLAEQVAINIDHLNYRYSRLSAIDVTDSSNKEEFFMAFDAFLVLFRALFLENRDTHNIPYNITIGQKQMMIQQTKLMRFLINRYLNGQSCLFVKC